MFMTKEEYYKIIAEMETLPTGNITYKKINGREYAYYQWRELEEIGCVHEQVAKLGPVSRAAGMDCEYPLDNSRKEIEGIL